MTDNLKGIPRVFWNLKHHIFWLLARYQQEFDGDLSTEMAERFYHQAIYINPDLGVNILHKSMFFKWLPQI